MAALLLAGLTGCQTAEKYSLTYRLWNSDDLRKWSEPAEDPKLALFEASNRTDVLVHYDAFSEQHSEIKRRAYFLEPNKKRVETGKKPTFAKVPVENAMTPIPILPKEVAASNRPPDLTAYAVINQQGRGFTLYRSNGRDGDFDLPVYAESPGTPIRVALTPFALAGDTVMVGLVAAFVGLLIWVQSGAPIH